MITGEGDDEHVSHMTTAAAAAASSSGAVGGTVSGEQTIVHEVHDNDDLTDQTIIIGMCLGH